jgi:ectoine hydroxylase-related dioxygenase (phytanoyl-CoA dioxygenase family)
VNNTWAFAPMTASNELVGDADALRARLDEEGYLYFSELIDRERVLDLRRDFLTVLSEKGWTPGEPHLDSGRCLRPHVREGEDEFFEVYDEIQKLESFHSLAHDDELLGALRGAVDETAFPHPLKVARLSFPTSPEVTTPPHQDHLNNQGTKKLTAAWIPLGDVPMQQGTLAVLRGSNRFGVLPLKYHLGAGNRQASLPTEMIEQLTWVTNDMSAGDVLLFPSLTVHASLHNATKKMRLSVDYRYQPEGEPLSNLVLRPHFERFEWDEIYADWESDELQYYWRDLDYDVIEFDRSVFTEAEPTHEDMGVALRYERNRKLEREEFERASRPG